METLDVDQAEMLARAPLLGEVLDVRKAQAVLLSAAHPDALFCSEQILAAHTAIDTSVQRTTQHEHATFAQDVALNDIGAYANARVSFLFFSLSGKASLNIKFESFRRSAQVTLTTRIVLYRAIFSPVVVAARVGVANRAFVMQQRGTHVVASQLRGHFVRLRVTYADAQSSVRSSVRSSGALGAPVGAVLRAIKGALVKDKGRTAADDPGDTGDVQIFFETSQGSLTTLLNCQLSQSGRRGMDRLEFALEQYRSVVSHSALADRVGAVTLAFACLPLVAIQQSLGFASPAAPLAVASSADDAQEVQCGISDLCDRVALTQEQALETFCALRELRWASQLSTSALSAPISIRYRPVEWLAEMQWLVEWLDDLTATLVALGRRFALHDTGSIHDDSEDIALVKQLDSELQALSLWGLGHEGTASTTCPLSSRPMLTASLRDRLINANLLPMQCADAGIPWHADPASPEGAMLTAVRAGGDVCAHGRRLRAPDDASQCVVLVAMLPVIQSLVSVGPLLIPCDRAAEETVPTAPSWLAPHTTLSQIRSLPNRRSLREANGGVDINEKQLAVAFEPTLWGLRLPTTIGNVSRFTAVWTTLLDAPAFCHQHRLPAGCLRAVVVPLSSPIDPPSLKAYVRGVLCADLTTPAAFDVPSAPSPATVGFVLRVRLITVVTRNESATSEPSPKLCSCAAPSLAAAGGVVIRTRLRLVVDRTEDAFDSLSNVAVVTAGRRDNRGNPESWSEQERADAATLFEDFSGRYPDVTSGCISVLEGERAPHVFLCQARGGGRGRRYAIVHADVVEIPTTSTRPDISKPTPVLASDPDGLWEWFAGPLNASCVAAAAQRTPPVAPPAPVYLRLRAMRCGAAALVGPASPIRAAIGLAIPYPRGWPSGQPTIISFIGAERGMGRLFVVAQGEQLAAISASLIIGSTVPPTGFAWNIDVVGPHGQVAISARLPQGAGTIYWYVCKKQHSTITDMSEFSLTLLIIRQGALIAEQLRHDRALHFAIVARTGTLRYRDNRNDWKREGSDDEQEIDDAFSILPVIAPHRLLVAHDDADALTLFDRAAPRTDSTKAERDVATLGNHDDDGCSRRVEEAASFNFSERCQ